MPKVGGSVPYRYLASTFVNSQSKSNSLPSHISRELKNSTAVDIISKRFEFEFEQSSIAFVLLQQ